LQPGIIDVRASYRAAARRLRITALNLFGGYPVRTSTGSLPKLLEVIHVFSQYIRTPGYYLAQTTSVFLLNTLKLTRICYSLSVTYWGYKMLLAEVAFRKS
jgi:hypothetical protein